MKTIDIKGKKYVEVNERVKFFRENFKDHQMKTEWLQLDLEGNVACKVSILKDNVVISEGTAFERAGSSFINKTSHVENCETSAVGRALGFMGIGIDASIASADEVNTAIVNQNPIKKDSPKFKKTNDDSIKLITEHPAFDSSRKNWINTIDNKVKTDADAQRFNETVKTTINNFEQEN